MPVCTGAEAFKTLNPGEYCRCLRNGLWFLRCPTGARGSLNTDPPAIGLQPPHHTLEDAAGRLTVFEMLTFSDGTRWLLRDGYWTGPL